MNFLKHPKKHGTLASYQSLSLHFHNSPPLDTSLTSTNITSAILATLFDGCHLPFCSFFKTSSYILSISVMVTHETSVRLT